MDKSVGVQESTGQTFPSEPSVEMQHVGVRFQSLLFLANLVVWLVIVPLQSVVLPAQFSILDPKNATGSFALASLFTGVIALIAQPLSGTLSDLTSSRFGRRRPWIVIGTLATLALLLLMAHAPTVILLTIVYTAFGASINCVLAPLISVVADRVPVGQRASVSGVVGLSQSLATLSGLALFAFVFRAITATYYAYAVCLVLGIALFVLLVSEPALPHEHTRFSLGAFFREFFHPLRYADYRFVLATRFFVVMAQLLVASFLYFYLEGVIQYASLFPGHTASEGIFFFQAIFTVCVVASSLVAGWWSDRVQRRKAFVVAACVIMTLALLLLALVPTWTVVLVVGALFGIGFGVFLSADLALATQVIPAASENGKGIGLYLAGGTLPFLLFPLIQGIALGQLHSFAVLFGIAAAATLLAIFCILPVKGVR